MSRDTQDEFDAKRKKWIDELKKIDLYAQYDAIDRNKFELENNIIDGFLNRQNDNVDTLITQFKKQIDEMKSYLESLTKMRNEFRAMLAKSVMADYRGNN